MKGNNNEIIIFLIVIGLLGIAIWVYAKFIGAKPKDSITMLNGDVGSGKTSTGLYLVIGDNQRKKAITKIKNWFRRLFKKKELETPYIYCNMPLFNIEYKEFTIEHLMRKKRFEYNSTIFLNECSLIADSMLAFNMGKDQARRFVNDQLKLFCKLIRHELKGKNLCMVLDTQNPNDLALAGDRVLSSTNIILNWINWIPFIRPVKIRQIKINLENVNNNFNEDSRNDNSKWILVNKKVFKMYNSHCYEFLTRERPIETKVNYTKLTKQNKNLFDAEFIIPTLTEYEEIKLSNAKIKMKKGMKLDELDIKILKQYGYIKEQKKGEKENGENK